MMPFCSNCGLKVTSEAKFCPECGQQLKAHRPVTVSPPEESIPVKPVVHKDKAYTLLEIGTLFKGKYRIEKIIGRDNDGISYLALEEASGKQRSLKLFYQSYFDNVSKLLGSISQLAKIKDISHPHVAQVYEVNQSSTPVYIAAEYIDGVSLSRIKDQHPDQLTEEKCRIIASQLIDVAAAIRKAGLSIRNLTFQNIIYREDGSIVVLSSGISYDFRDEKEEIFSFGILLAKLFSTSAFYETLYTQKKLFEKKFDFISGVTHQVNEIIAKSLNRTISMRYGSFHDLARGFKNLKPVKQENIYYSSDAEPGLFKDKEELATPGHRLDIYFWLMIIFIIVFISMLMTTNLLDTIFGHQKTPFKFTGFLTETADSTDELVSVAQDNYRKIPASGPIVRRRINSTELDFNPKRSNVNTDISIPPSQPILSNVQKTPVSNYTKNQTTRKVSLPSTAEGLVYIYGDTYPYGTLKKDARDNVSLNGYYIGRAEVTQIEWNRHMKPAPTSVTGENLPVDNITWFEAVQYCNVRSEAEGLTPCYKILGTSSSRVVTCNFKANGYRLPTEAEWEYAARANNLTRYSGSNSLENVAWYKENAQAHIHLVKTKSDNGFGLYDMTGNVSEWCWDWFDSNYPQNMPFINPTGPESGTNKSIRGGSINNDEGSALELMTRSRGVPSRGYRYNGFRVVRSK